jgi:hypothetical protein
VGIPDFYSGQYFRKRTDIYFAAGGTCLLHLPHNRSMDEWILSAKNGKIKTAGST